tara:strand:- start:1725 stop:1853 length:129 start_codon:yes stop_codon:yes gene_type:complete
MGKTPMLPLRKLVDYTPPGLPQEILDIIEETKKRAIKEGRWR